MLNTTSSSRSPPPDSSTDIAVLRLEGFAAPAYLDYGNVQVRTTAWRTLRIYNPSTQAITASIEPNPSLSIEQTEVSIDPQGQVDVAISWSPTEGSVEGKNYRIPLTVKGHSRQRFKVVMTGTSLCVKPSKKKSPELVLQCSDFDENIRPNGVPSSVAWKAEFKRRPSGVRPSEKKTKQIMTSGEVNPIHGGKQQQAEPNAGLHWIAHHQTKPIETRTATEVNAPSKGSCSGRTPLVSVSKIAPYFSNNDEFESRKSADFELSKEASQKLKHSMKSKAHTNTLKGKVDKIDPTKKRSSIDIPKRCPPPRKKKIKAAAPFRQQQFYDENWALKQENAFVVWMNFIFGQREKPDAFYPGQRGAGSYMSVNEHRAHAQLLHQAFNCYRSSPVQNIIHSVEQAISLGQLRIRDDINMLSDLGLRDRFVEIIMSYSPAWLSLALETVYGELLSPSACLRQFIQTRLLSNTELDEEHTYLRTSKGQAFFDSKRKSSLQAFVLKKAMQIILFLDISKSQYVFNDSPRLFTCSGSLKSTKAILNELASTFMGAQGDLVKQIAQISGYDCATVQRPLDEFDYKVVDLGADLRDGVRLCSLTFVGDLDLQILLPAINKSRKKHNVQLALQHFAKQGVPMIQCSVDDVVEGNRQRTLILLWHIVSHLTIPSLINVPLLFNEVRLIRRRLNLSITMNAGDASATFYGNNPVLQLLLRWCQSICCGYDVPVSNMTSSFSGGRAFAFIIHYYYPQLIPRASIRDTIRTLQERKRREGGKDLYGLSDDAYLQYLCLHAPQDQMDAALAGERHNWRLVANAVSELGAIPFIFNDLARHGTGTDVVLDEKTVILFLSYLSARLLMLSKESDAARVIQTRWRHKEYCRRQVRLPRAAATLTGPIVTYHQFSLAAKTLDAVIVVLQPTLAAILSRRRFQSVRSSTTCIRQQICLYLECSRSETLQTSLSSYLTGKMFTSLQLRRRRYAAMVLQRRFRRHRRHRAATILQWSLSTVSRRLQCVAALSLREQCAVKRIQRETRRFLLQRRRDRVAVLGSAICAVVARARHDHTLRLRREVAARCLQRRFRSFVARRASIRCGQAAVEAVRCSIVFGRLLYQRRRRAAVALQCRWRRRCAIRSLAAESIRHVLYAVLVKNSFVRQLQLRRSRGAILIQKVVREHLRRVHRRRVLAVMSLQSWFSAGRAHSSFCRQLTRRRSNCAIMIQRSFRGHHQRRIAAATALQSALLSRNVAIASCRFRLMQRHRVARCIQERVRAHQRRRRLGAIAGALASLHQSRAFSSFCIARQYNAAARLQRYWRKHHHRRVASAEILQTFVTVRRSVRSLAKLQGLRRHRSASILQASWCRYHEIRKQQRLDSSITVEAGLAAWADHIRHRRSAALMQRHCSRRIQSCARRYLHHRLLTFSSQVLQASLGSSGVVRHAQALLSLRRVRSAQTIQRYYRRYQIRVRAATSLQAIIVARRLQTGYQRLRSLIEQSAACRIQRSYRKHHARRAAASSTLQALIESSRVRSAHRALMLSRRRHAATVIQQRYRRHRARLIAASTAVQAVLKSLCVSRCSARVLCCRRLNAVRLIELRYQQHRFRCRVASSTTLQATFESLRVHHIHGRRMHFRRLHAVGVLHSFSKSIRSRVRAAAASALLAALTSVHRSARFNKLITIHRRRQRHRALTLLESAMDRFQLGQAEKRQKAAAAIEAMTNAIITARSFQRLWLWRRAVSATAIQRNWRLFFQRRSRALQAGLHAGAMAIRSRKLIAIQHRSASRRIIRAVRDHRKRQFVRRIQGALASTMASRRAESVAEFRKLFLIRVVQRRYREKLIPRAIAATTMQSALSLLLDVRRTMSLVPLRQRLAATTIQRLARRFLMATRKAHADRRLSAVVAVQGAFEGLVALQSMSRMRHDVIQVQAIWRGRIQRQKASKSVDQARIRIQGALSRWAPELTIGFRLEQALDILLSGSMLSPLTHACRTLDQVTRTLPRCAIDAVQHKAVPVLYALMRGLNRSKPHLELLGYALNILVSLSGNQQTRSAVFLDESCSEVLMELLQTQRDNADLFGKASWLLLVGCEAFPKFAIALQSSGKRISSIHMLLSRKLDMSTRYQTSSSQAKQIGILKRSVRVIEMLQTRMMSYQQQPDQHS